MGHYSQRNGYFIFEKEKVPIFASPDLSDFKVCFFIEKFNGFMRDYINSSIYYYNYGIGQFSIYNNEQ